MSKYVLIYGETVPMQFMLSKRDVRIDHTRQILGDRPCPHAANRAQSKTRDPES